MRNLTEVSLKNQSLVWYFIVMSVIGGIFAYINLGRMENPAFTIKDMIVSAAWPGATAEQMALQVTDKLEKKLQDIPGLDNLQSETRPNSTVIYVELGDNLDVSEIRPTWRDVRNYCADIKGDLPEGVMGPFFNDTYDEVFGSIYALTGDGFSYETWGGYDMLPKLNLRNPEVRDYHFETIRFWIEKFDIDGLRLDAADVMDMGFLQDMRRTACSLKEDFWLMGEVIHGEYSRWVNTDTLHSVTNYALHKALYSAHNDHNYFEIAHTIRRQMQMGLGEGTFLYDFVDNHDVERIITKLRDKAHFLPVHVLLFTLPGIPSIYYGSELGIEGRKERGSDASLRPALSIPELSAADNPMLEIIKALGKVYDKESALWYGEYREIALTTTKYAFMRGDVLITVTNSGEESFDLELTGSYTGALSGREISSDQGRLRFTLDGGCGEIWIPSDERKSYEPLKQKIEKTETERGNRTMPKRAAEGKSPEDMSIEELQAEVLGRLSANGPLTDRMIREVQENVYRDSLLNWVRSFR